MKYVYKGAIHIHSTYSDGTGTIPEIAKAAKKAGLDWIIITDHNTLAGLNNAEEGWYDGVAVLIGEEISPKHGDHYIALNINKEINHDQPPESYIEEVNNLGGIGFIAHPDEREYRKLKQKSLRWTDWDISGFNGIEIWNFLSDWGDNYDPKRPLIDYFFRSNVLTGPTQDVLRWWDVLNLKNEDIIPAIGGVDAHALIRKYMGVNVKVFPYYDNFRTITNNIYLDDKISKDFDFAKNQILDAIKSGKNIIVNQNWSDKPIEFYLQAREDKILPGEAIAIDQADSINVSLPKKARIRLIYNGNQVYEAYGKELRYSTLQPGKYRLEAFYNNKPWVFSNPILIR